MQRLLLTLITIILTAYASISQTLDSTTCLPNQQLKTAINIIERGKVTLEELGLTKQKVADLQLVIATKDSIIQYLTVINTTNQQIAERYRLMAEQNAKAMQETEKQLNLMGKKANRQKTMKWVAFGLGLVGGYFIFH